MFEEVDGVFDHIIFNPPYLPVEEEGRLPAAWAGGERGMRVTSRFMDGAPPHLTPGGEVTLLVSSENGVEDVMKGFVDSGFTPEIKASKKLFFEELHIVKAVYKS